jgi:hypothetical protein
MRKAEADGSSDNRLLAGLPRASKDRLCAKAQLVSVSVEDIHWSRLEKRLPAIAIGSLKTNLHACFPADLGL